jgi:hypothetical protein
VTEATATRRDKTVKSALNTAGRAAVGDNDLAQAALITAIANQDGEGMSELQKYARKKGIQLGLIEPNDEEKAQAKAVGGPVAAPDAPSGLEQVHKAVQIRKDAAAADHLETTTSHLPEKLAIERTNAETNRLKVHQHGALERFKSLFTGPARPRQ